MDIENAREYWQPNPSFGRKINYGVAFSVGGLIAMGLYVLTCILLNLVAGPDDAPWTRTETAAWAQVVGSFAIIAVTAYIARSSERNRKRALYDHQRKKAIGHFVLLKDACTTVRLNGAIFQRSFESMNAATSSDTFKARMFSDPFTAPPEFKSALQEVDLLPDEIISPLIETSSLANRLALATLEMKNQIDSRNNIALGHYIYNSPPSKRRELYIGSDQLLEMLLESSRKLGAACNELIIDRVGGKFVDSPLGH